MPRLYVDLPLSVADDVALPPAAARHVQVLRLQPGDGVVLFDGRGGEWSARVRRMGRADVSVDVASHSPVDRELPVAVTLAVAMPANERMDALVEKATELGAAAIRPLVAERSVLRLAGERAERRRAHWQAVATAASEQSGRTRVPVVQPVRALDAWLAEPSEAAARWVLSTADAPPLRAMPPPPPSLVVLSGPEGGFSPAELQRAADAGFVAVSLGPRILRADTAPLAALAGIALRGADEAPR
jgi:16S rRNA (uracil1498-N3)-methyltransferase